MASSSALSWKKRLAAWLLTPLLALTAADSQQPSVPLSFSANPTSAEIAGAQIFAEPLLPAGEAAAAENAALAAALTSYAARTGREDVTALTGFLAARPQSPWRSSLWLNLGLLTTTAVGFPRPSTLGKMPGSKAGRKPPPRSAPLPTKPWDNSRK